MLVDTLTLIGKRTDLRERLDLPFGKPYSDWATRFETLRNTLAHGGAILDVEPEAQRAAELFSEVRRFAELSWQKAAFSSA
jgi:L-ribulose-5-phosphate 3-epimerase UlaE